MGLVLDTLKIQNVTDDANYLNSSGRMSGANVRMQASIVEARTQAEAAEQKADNWARSEVAKIDADLAIARQETDKRIKDALSKREAMIFEARGQVLAQIAQARAEISRQTARALQVERQLVADVIQPADAERRNLEEQARGDAAKIIEMGRAEAEALKLLVAEFRKAGPNAREVLALQQMMPLLPEISGARRATKIATLSVLPGDESGEGNLARRAISAAAQIRAATGLDLTALASRFGAGSQDISALQESVAPQQLAPMNSPPPPPPGRARRG
jgi:flotillin